MTCDSCRSVVISALCSSDGWALCSPICAGGCMLIISSIIAVRHAVGACLARALLAVVHGLGDVVPGPAQGRPLLARCSVGEALTFGLTGSITVQRVVYNAIVHVLPRQAEAGIVGWPVDDKRERERLTPLAAIVGAHADVMVRVGPAALVDLVQNRCRVFHIEHGQAPHLPVAVARVRIIGELYIDGPAIVQAVLYLQADLVVAQIRQEGKRALCQMKCHESSSLCLVTRCRCGIGRIG